MVFVIQNFYWDFLFVGHFKLFNSLVGSSKKAELTSHRLDSSSCLCAVACKPGFFFFVYPDVLRFPARSFRFYFRASGIFNSPSQFSKLRDFSMFTKKCLKILFFGRKFCVKLSRVYLGQSEYSFTTFAHCIWDTAIMDFLAL